MRCSLFINVTVGSIAAIIDALNNRGGVLISGIRSRTEILTLCNKLGALRGHPDSDPDGLTTISDRGGTAESGRLGFSSLPLSLHTDRSIEQYPPAFSLLWCEAKSPAGGSTLFCDGQHIYRHLLHNHPKALTLLKEPVLLIGGNKRAVFQHENDRVFIRYRNDCLMHPRPDAIHALRLLDHAIKAHTTSYLLGNHEAYLINNGWILHGREAFQGKRTVVRAFINPDGPEQISRGFFH